MGKNKVLREFSKVKILALDFDGVLTNNKVYISEEGIESVVCDRRDGFGLENLRNKTEVKCVILSKETNPIVSVRAKKLKIPAVQGLTKKIISLREIVKDQNLKIDQVCFIGNDLNDLECIKEAGMGVAVSDSIGEVKRFADYVTKSKGGEGAVREICDLIIASKQRKA